MRGVELPKLRGLLGPHGPPILGIESTLFQRVPFVNRLQMVFEGNKWSQK